MRAAAVVVVVLSAALACACRTKPSDGAADPAESPQAQAVPAPLSSPPSGLASAAAMGSDAGPAPTPFESTERLAVDPVAREAAGLSLVAVLRPGDTTVRAPEAPAAAVDALKKKLEARLVVELTATRLRIAQAGAGFVLPHDAEIRARADRYGHVAVFGAGTYYRPLPPGALRTFLDERRFDVAPLAPARLAPVEGAGRRLDARTRRVSLATRAGKVDVEVARLPETGEAGVLFGRFLVDLVSGSPGAALVGVDELPVHADIRWTDGGQLVLEVTNVLRKPALDPTLLAAPPVGAAFGDNPLPTGGLVPTLTPAELGTLRGPSTEPTGPLVVVNGKPEVRVIVLDGVAVAWVAPLARAELHGLPAGRYLAATRTALGLAPESHGTVTVPGTLGGETP